MTPEQLIDVVEIVKRKADEAYDEVRELLEPGETVSEEVAGTDRTASVIEREQADEPWVLTDTVPSGDWVEVGRTTGETYKWPDGTVDHFPEFFIYRGKGGFDGMSLALGYIDEGPKRGDVVGFVLGSGGGSMRGITYFFPADDFATSNEKVSMIKGGGPRGRSGFGPSDPVPPAYSGFKTDVLRDRKAGKWNVLAVVAEADDYKAMLTHTAIQAKLRKLA